VLGVSCEDYRQPGAFADFVVVPQRILYRLPENLSFEHAALVEPFAIALHAVRRSPPALGDAVVVVGAGMIGLALIQALNNAGCCQLMAVDVAPDRLAIAATSGATRTIHSVTENPLEAIANATDGRGADVVFEAVGLPATVELALHCARKGGSVTLVGNITPKVEFPLQIVVTRELSVFGSCASRGEYSACLELMGRGALRPASFISATPALGDGALWFDRLYKKEPGLLKVILEP
jgi:L-iditol 2-dehydrogenase